MFELGPIFRTLLRNKLGALLIIIQTALTFAVVANALFVIQQRQQHIDRPSGIVEQELFVVSAEPIDGGTTPVPQMQRDLQAIRQLPGVIDASFVSSIPMSNSGSSASVNDAAIAQPSQADGVITNLYQADEHSLHTLGLTLIAGRYIQATDITNDSNIPPAIVISRTLADELFGKDVPAVGRQIHISSAKPSTVVGVVAPFFGAYVAPIIKGVLIAPTLYSPYASYYLIRGKANQLDPLMKAVPALLRNLDEARVIRHVQRVTDFKERSYHRDHTMVVLMSCTMLLVTAATACGIVGLTQLWINQRRRQIGVRRALGATKLAIVRYFLVENGLMVFFGLLGGLLLALLFNHIMVQHYQMAALPGRYFLPGAITVILLSQLAATVPVWRATRISPALATRNI